MTPHAKFERYGAIVGEDVAVLEACLSAVMTLASRHEKKTLRVLEIGMHDGNTGHGIEAFLADRGWKIEYVGVDPDDGTKRPRHVPSGGRVIIGDSAESFHLVDGDFDLVWVDGCHCINHVILDTVHYAPKVRRGGFMLFHDANPKGQGTGHQYHGPEIPEFGLGIDSGHRAIHWPFQGWDLFAEQFPTEVGDCGTRAYRRLT